MPTHQNLSSITFELVGMFVPPDFMLIKILFNGVKIITCTFKLSVQCAKICCMELTLKSSVS